MTGPARHIKSFFELLRHVMVKGAKWKLTLSTKTTASPWLIYKVQGCPICSRYVWTDHIALR